MELIFFAMKLIAVAAAAFAATAYFANKAGNEKLFEKAKKNAISLLVMLAGLIAMAIAFNIVLKKIDEAFDPNTSPILKPQEKKTQENKAKPK